MTAYGITESGILCDFDFTLGAKFDVGAGVAPTHGGFLMCGRRSGYFSVSEENTIYDILIS